MCVARCRVFTQPRPIADIDHHSPTTRRDGFGRHGLAQLGRPLERVWTNERRRRMLWLLYHTRAAMSELKRRDFLKTTAALAAVSAAGRFGCVEIASAAPIETPVVDRVSVRVVIDGAYNLFLRPGEVKSV